MDELDEILGKMSGNGQQESNDIYGSYFEWEDDHEDYVKEFLTDDARNFGNILFLNKLLYDVHGYVAGGCFKDIIMGKAPRDIDVYFETTDAFYSAIALFNSRVEQNKAKKTYASNNVQAYIYQGYTIELVEKWHLEPIRLIMEFDFNIDKFAYCPDTGYVHYHKDFFKDLVMHRLTVSGYPPFPIATYNRMFKYAKYGYMPCRQTKMLLASIINGLPVLDDNDFGNSFYEGFD